jgi:ribosomal protein L37AE/L43A
MSDSLLINKKSNKLGNFNILDNKEYIAKKLQNDLEYVIRTIKSLNTKVQSIENKIKNTNINTVKKMNLKKNKQKKIYKCLKCNNKFTDKNVLVTSNINKLPCYFILKCNNCHKNKEKEKIDKIIKKKFEQQIFENLATNFNKIHIN